MDYSPHRIFAVLLLFLIAGGCDSGGDTADFTNDFSLTIESLNPRSETVTREPAQKELSGFSFFYDGKNPDTGKQVFVIYLSDSENFSSQNVTQGLFGFIATLRERPERGTYELASPNPVLAPNQFSAVVYEDFANPQQIAFHVVGSGTLTIDASTQDRVVGSIEATGTSHLPEDSTRTQKAINVQGSFIAKSVGSFVSPATPGL